MTRYLQQLIATTAAVLGLALPSHAAVVLFQDNFDTDNAASALNFTAFNNWTVSNGTVDYIRNGDFGINCVGGAGGCVDLDGSTSNGGLMTSNALFNILAGETYEISVEVSGNQRGTGPDDITFGLNGLVSLTHTDILPSAPFTVRSLSFNGVAGTSAFFIDTTSADNVGVIIDNVTLTCLTCNPNNVPEPSALALLGLGLIGCLGFARKRV